MTVGRQRGVGIVERGLEYVNEWINDSGQEGCGHDSKVVAVVGGG